MIKGVVCGYRIEDIAEEFDVYKRCRQLEKLIDELAKGRKLEKILRTPKYASKFYGVSNACESINNIVGLREFGFLQVLKTDL